MIHRPRIQMLACVSIVSLSAFAALGFPPPAIQERTDSGSPNEKKGNQPTLPADWVKSLSWFGTVPTVRCTRGEPTVSPGKVLPMRR